MISSLLLNVFQFNRFYIFKSRNVFFYCTFNESYRTSIVTLCVVSFARWQLYFHDVSACLFFILVKNGKLMFIFHFKFSVVSENESNGRCTDIVVAAVHFRLCDLNEA